jgi:predicted ester cyclase
MPFPNCPKPGSTTLLTPGTRMTRAELTNLYFAYIACLNAQDWPKLGDFVHADVQRNGERLGLAGYRAMLEDDFRAIPNLRFDVQLLLADPPRIAARLRFDCTPTGSLFGLPIDGRRVRFAENVIYEIADGRIATVWSVIDQAAIAAQL